MKKKVVKVKVRYEKGLHVRVAAMIVQTAGEMQREYDVDFKIKVGTFNEVPLTSILLVTALKIKQDDELDLITTGEKVEEASIKMKDYLEGDFDVAEETITEVDDLLQDNMVTAESVFGAIDNGLVVVDQKETITIFNRQAEEIFGMKAGDVLGKQINQVFPNHQLKEVQETLKTYPPYQTKVKDRNVMVTTTPIQENQLMKGAILVLDDISKIVAMSYDLDEIKLLKERYLQILETVQDGICVFDEKGIVTYVNAAYKAVTGGICVEGSDINSLSPTGNRMKVLKTGEKIQGGISHKANGTTIIANITPIVVDHHITGGISVVKDITEIEELMETISHLTAKTEYLEEELNRKNKLDQAFNRIIGNSSKLYDAMKIASKTSNNNLNVLIRGESGTGKELIAEAIHYSSKRKEQPFVRVNCAAIPANLLESEMFGHIKGAYTGAIKTKMGKFELADGGTIFLDEIGELDKSMQAKMLRVIQKKEFQRVGDEKTISVDVRIVAATNRDLEKLVDEGDFREDLYYRLNVIPIWLPPLRERKSDVPLLLEHFLKKIAAEVGENAKKLSAKTLDTLSNYSWPGNIRELENLVERIVVLSDGELIEMDQLPSYILDNHLSPGSKTKSELKAEAVIEENTLSEQSDQLSNVETSDLSFADDIQTWEFYEKKIIQEALKKYKSYNAAGKALGISHKTVAAKARKYGIELS